MVVIGREGADEASHLDTGERRKPRGREGANGPAGRLGYYRARDGSRGAAVDFDLDCPHAGLVVGKRGSGKTYTLGVLAEGLLAADGIAPVVVDPMGAFAPLADADVPATVVDPRVCADALGPRQWCTVLGLDPERAAGALVWRAASERATLDGMGEWIAAAPAADATRRAAENLLSLAASWDVFDPDGLSVSDLCGGDLTVVDVAGLDTRPAGAVLSAVATALYDARVGGETARLPWLLVDEAHAFTDGVAARPLRRLLTRGRQPGVSVVLATQRPSSLPSTAISQADVLIAHRLTSAADVDALRAARPTYLDGDFASRLPTDTGEALVVDDATESVHRVTVRERETTHGGGSPRASDRPSATTRTDGGI
ncbi:ATP-binding protein [Haloarcula salina]|uniref:ATP-binding protein n=1 Tax=Haloarcula salina TaxID=1429914 RepID=A0AA41KJF9_9EURY|nr:ATP-binding protein [Haloarcula salina]MBV0903821.1 ATP-binding protein [Haloarcula salina]